MATIFSQPPPQLPVFRALPPELIPATAPGGSFIVGVGLGRITLTGATASSTFGQIFNVGAGAILYQGAVGGLALGNPPGYSASPGQINYFGYPAIIGATVTPPPPVVAGIPFDPALSEMALDAWERCNVQAGALTVTHFNSMRRSMNFVLSRWSNRGINLWKVDLVSLPLLANVKTYSIDTSIIDVLDTVVRSGDGISGPSDIVVTPMSRNTYAALTNKDTPGRPNQFWFDRTIPPTLTLWPVPDVSNVYTLNYYVFRQMMNVDPTMGTKSALPYRFLEAYTAALAAHLAQKWADPQRAVALDLYAKEAWSEAEGEDREHVTTNISPDLSRYMN